MIKYVYFKWTQVWTGSFWLLTLKDQHGDLWKFWDLPWWPLTLSEAMVEFPQHEASQTGIFFSPPHVERKWNSAPQVTHKERSLCGLLLHTALLGVGLWLRHKYNPGEKGKCTSFKELALCVLSSAFSACSIYDVFSTLLGQQYSFKAFCVLLIYLL